MPWGSRPRRLTRTKLVNREGIAKAVVRLTELYIEIYSDPRYSTSKELQKYRTLIWSRLQRVKREIERRYRNTSDPATPRVLQAASTTTGLGGAPGPPDYGPRLVALIERTISPEFWDVHGGPGTIYYYRPLRVLVVRATDDLHGRIGRVVTDLRDK